MIRPLIFLFPGQSSRDAGMFERLMPLAPAATEAALLAFEQAAGKPFTGEFAENTETQLAVFLATRVYRMLAEERGLAPVASAGLSLGEYSHLAQIGALNEAAAVELIAARGRAYDAGPPGMMAAVQPASEADVQPLIDRVRSELDAGPGDLAISNYNSPKQLVVAGRADAVERFIELVYDELYITCTVIEHRIPMHTARFAPVTERFRPVLEQFDWQSPSAAWWSNVTGEPVTTPTPATFTELLSRHVYEPVQWQRTLEGLIARHPDAVLVEVGPRRVLRQMIRSWCKTARIFSLDPEEASAGIDVFEEIARARE